MKLLVIVNIGNSALLLWCNNATMFVCLLVLCLYYSIISWKGRPAGANSSGETLLT